MQSPPLSAVSLSTRISLSSPRSKAAQDMVGTPTSEAHMDKCCDICGDVGVIDAIVTCTRCNSSCEHLYCMRTCREGHPESWCCEMCEDLIKPSPKDTPGKLQCDSAHRNQLPNDLRQGSMDCEKKIQTGKVKPLSAQEVIMLTSGAKKSGSPVEASFHPSAIVRKKRSMLERTPIKTGCCPPKSNSKLVTGVAASSNMNIPIADSRSASPLNAPSKDDKCLYIPASDASWKGSFNVLFIDPKQGEVSGGIQAYPPFTVRKKVYESSKLMPEVLEFELVQRGSLWMSLFGSYSPDRRDIGLYFFPSTCERCKNYKSLLEHIGEHDLVLRKYMDGLELLIFTSKLLRMDCQRLNGMYFLWGVFRRFKLTLATIRADINQCHDEDDNSEAVEMEIDMIGGENVGRLDIAVPRISPQLPLPNIAEETLYDIPPGFEKICRPKVQTSCVPSAKCGFGSLVKVEKADEKDQMPSQLRLPKIAEKILYDVPPGFEKRYRPKVQAPYASAEKCGFGSHIKVERPNARDQRYWGTLMWKDDSVQTSSKPMVSPRLDCQPPLKNVKSEF